jgi:hypothetical protein
LEGKGLKAGLIDLVMLLCWLAKKNRKDGYAFPHQDWLAKRLRASIRTIGSRVHAAHTQGLVDRVQTAHGNHYFPRWENLGFAEEIADDIGNICRSPFNAFLKTDIVAEPTVPPDPPPNETPTAPAPDSLTRSERTALRDLPGGEGAIKLLGRHWLRKEPALAADAVRRVLTHERSGKPVWNAAGLLLSIYKGNLDRRQALLTRLAEEPEAKLHDGPARWHKSLDPKDDADPDDTPRSLRRDMPADRGYQPSEAARKLFARYQPPEVA